MAVTWCFAYFVLLGSIISEEVLSRMTVCFRTLLKLFYMACHLSWGDSDNKRLKRELAISSEIEEDWRRQTVQSILDNWTNFARTISGNPFYPTLPNVIDFFTHLYDTESSYSAIKVFPQKLKLPMIFFKLSLNVLHQALFRKKSIKMIGHHSRLRDMMGQSYPIYACSRANHAHYSSVHVKFCSTSKHTLLK